MVRKRNHLLSLFYFSPKMVRFGEDLVRNEKKKKMIGCVFVYNAKIAFQNTNEENKISPISPSHIIFFLTHPNMMVRN